jgi:hypothetical protein
MSFVQLIEFNTPDVAAIQEANETWERATEGKRTARRQVLARDHHDPNRYFALVFFDSYESAMVNSGMPETQAAAETYARLTDGPPAFYDLDIIEDRA